MLYIFSVLLPVFKTSSALGTLFREIIEKKLFDVLALSLHEELFVVEKTPHKVKWPRIGGWGLDTVIHKKNSCSI